MFPEEGPYRFINYYPPYGWKQAAGVPGLSAMRVAADMLGVEDMRRLRVQAVMHEGRAIGYQVSPPRQPPSFNTAPYFDISYFLRDGTVRIQVVPSPFYHGY